MALRIIDSIDPMVTVEATTTVDAMVAKVRSGEDPTWHELRSVFGPGGSHEAPVALPPTSD